MLGFMLVTAIQKNTKALEENNRSNAELLSVATRTEKAASYLAQIERHRQISSGQKYEFSEAN